MGGIVHVLIVAGLNRMDVPAPVGQPHARPAHELAEREPLRAPLSCVPVPHSPLSDCACLLQLHSDCSLHRCACGAPPPLALSSQAPCPTCMQRLHLSGDCHHGVACACMGSLCKASVSGNLSYFQEPEVRIVSVVRSLSPFYADKGVCGGGGGGRTHG